MEIHYRPWADIGGVVRDTWNLLRSTDPALRSPYFTWEYFDAVARCTGRLELAVFRSHGQDVGYLPFERVTPRVAVPGGTPMNDFQGVVAAPGFAFEPRDFLAACGLDSFTYRNVLAMQASWARYESGRRCSPYLWLPDGFAAWTARSGVPPGAAGSAGCGNCGGHWPARTAPCASRRTSATAACWMR